jgi:diguanylate cyclase (GGDEF)-like protein/PAS domain S-box-containing protein
MGAANQNLVTDSERARLDALSRYNILDTPPESEFDDVVELAAYICGTSIATITLIDEERQWFKSKIGLTISETPRNIAFCAHAILQSEPLIVADTLADPRFAATPLVQGAPYLRFYAGIPLITIEGHAVGTLSVMDSVVKTLTADQVFALKVLARQVVAQLEAKSSIVKLNQLINERDQAQASLHLAHQQLELREAERTRELAQANAAYEEVERLYRTLWETTTDAILILDTENIIQYANPRTLQVLGYPPEQLIGENLTLVQPARFHDAHKRGFQRYLKSGAKMLDWRATEAVGLRPDGTEVPVEIAFSEMELDARRLFVGFFRDITERKKAEAVLFEEKERAQTTLKSIGDGVITTDIAGKILFLNFMAENLTGWRNEEAIGRELREVLNVKDEESGQPVSDPVQKVVRLAEPTIIVGRGVLIRRDGKEFSIEDSVAQILDRNRKVVGTVIAFRDVSLARKMAAKISYQASHDPLTGLINRIEFNRRLRMALKSASTQGRNHSLLYLDLDQFKVVNDTCGHIAGDELLKQLSGVLQLNLDGSDTLARLGGDEFGILLENCPPDRAFDIAEKLRKAVVDFPFAWQDKLFKIGVSIGQVNFCDGSLTQTEILSTGDAACYVAKDRGRNRVHTYQPDDQALALRYSEMEWIGQINKALKENRLCLYAQPIVDLQHTSESAMHIEVLLRMRDPNGRIIPPMAFIPAAERYNLMPTIDRWVIRTVFSYIAGLRRANHGQHFSSYAINLSGASLGDEDFPDFVREAFAETAIPASLICFEITETVAIGNLSNATKLMNEFKELGCSFALDDFGSGMSSFAYLKHLPVDFLKIDGSFIRDIVNDQINHAMVESINHIGHLMGLRTIAEFVENDLIVEKLRNIGVDFAQGYGLGKPVPFL